MSYNKYPNTQIPNNSLRTQPDDYARRVSRVVAAQICENVGFHSSNDSAMDAFAEIIVKYVRDLGRVASSYANMSRRTECNVFDVVKGLEDLGLSGSSSGSSAVKDLVEYVCLNEDVPFALPVSKFPVVVERRTVPSFEEMEEVPIGKHIPGWLPAFPDVHTYVYTSMWNDRKSDPRQDKVEQVRQRRKAERALLGLQQRLNFNGSKSVSLIESADNGFNEAVIDENPVTVLDAFAPAIEAARSGICELGDGERVSENRPLIFLKTGSGRKLLGRPSVLSLQSQSHRRRRSSFLGRDDERDDKKRRAEFILRQSMENPQELTQL